MLVSNVSRLPLAALLVAVLTIFGRARAGRQLRLPAGQAGDRQRLRPRTPRSSRSSKGSLRRGADPIAMMERLALEDTARDARHLPLPSRPIPGQARLRAVSLRRQSLFTEGPSLFTGRLPAAKDSSSDMKDTAVTRAISGFCSVLLPSVARLSRRSARARAGARQGQDRSRRADLQRLLLHLSRRQPDQQRPDPFDLRRLQGRRSRAVRDHGDERQEPDAAVERRPEAGPDRRAVELHPRQRVREVTANIFYFGFCLRFAKAHQRTLAVIPGRARSGRTRNPDAQAPLRDWIRVRPPSPFGFGAALRNGAGGHSWHRGFSGQLSSQPCRRDSSAPEVVRRGAPPSSSFLPPKREGSAGLALRLGLAPLRGAARRV